jgi:hypothetical protein
MNLLKLSLLMMLLGGAGGGIGASLGGPLGRGGALGTGLLLGGLLVVAGGFLAERWHWLAHSQRLWAILGGIGGFVLAMIVTLSTLASPFGPALSTLLIGIGAVLGAIVGNSAHGRGLTVGARDG